MFSHKGSHKNLHLGSSPATDSKWKRKTQYYLFAFCFHFEVTPSSAWDSLLVMLRDGTHSWWSTKGFYTVPTSILRPPTRKACALVCCTLSSRRLIEGHCHYMKSHYGMLCGSPLYWRHLKEKPRKQINTLVQNLILNTQVFIKILSFKFKKKVSFLQLFMVGRNVYARFLPSYPDRENRANEPVHRLHQDHVNAEDQ